MTKIRFTGWNYGFQKISFNYFLREKCGMGLAEAKRTVDRILDKGTLELDFPELTEADEQRMTELGVKFERVEDE